MPCATKTVNTGTSYIRCPVLTRHFGKSTARVLQQLHFWLSRENLKYGIIHDGRQWIRNSYNQWYQQIKETQDLAIITIRRAFSELEQKGVVLANCFDDHKHYQGGTQVKSYTIDYDALELIVGNLKQTLISRPRSIVEQQEQLRSTRIGEGLAISFMDPAHTIITQNTRALKGSSYPDQMSTPPDQMSTPPNRYISIKQTIKHSILSASPSIKSSMTNIDYIEATKPDKPAMREINNNFDNNSQKMIHLWNEIVGEGREDRKVFPTSQRSKHLDAALIQHFNSDFSKFESFCHKITTCKFLMGEKTDFRANLDWAIRFENIQKIKEGAYSFGTRESNYKLKIASEGRGAGKDAIDSLNYSIFSADESPEARAIRRAIQQRVEDAYYRSYFLKTEIKVDKERVILYVPSTFVRDRIRTQFRDIYDLYFNEIHVGSAETYLKSKTKLTVMEHEHPIAHTDVASNSEPYIKGKPSITDVGCDVIYDVCEFILPEAIDFPNEDTIDPIENNIDIHLRQKTDDGTEMLSNAKSFNNLEKAMIEGNKSPRNYLHPIGNSLDNKYKEIMTLCDKMISIIEQSYMNECKLSEETTKAKVQSKFVMTKKKLIMKTEDTPTRSYNNKSRVSPRNKRAYPYTNNKKSPVNQANRRSQFNDFSYSYTTHIRKTNLALIYNFRPIKSHTHLMHTIDLAEEKFSLKPSILCFSERHPSSELRTCSLLKRESNTQSTCRPLIFTSSTSPPVEIIPL